MSLHVNEAALIDILVDCMNDIINNTSNSIQIEVIQMYKKLEYQENLGMNGEGGCAAEGSEIKITQSSLNHVWYHVNNK